MHVMVSLLSYQIQADDDIDTFAFTDKWLDKTMGPFY